MTDDCLFCLFFVRRMDYYKSIFIIVCLIIYIIYKLKFACLLLSHEVSSYLHYKVLYSYPFFGNFINNTML